jgi:FkbM family methyltransferase
VTMPDDPSEPAEDFRSSSEGRRHGWYGLKPLVKRALSWRGPHLLVRVAARAVPRLRESGRLPAPAGLKEVHGRALGATFVMLRPDRCIVAKELYWGRGRRPRAADAFAVDLFASVAGASDVVLDVGAYTGLFTIVAARANPSLEVHAFEIVPDVYEALFRNCIRNDILDRVTLHCRGMGDPAVRMRVPEGSGGSALPDYYSAKLHFESGPTIGFVALDAMMPLIADRVHVLMKVDVEGTEDEVFGFGRKFLERFGPDVLCEVLPQADVSELQRTLDPFGYRYHAVGAGELRTAPTIRPDERFRDWFFTRRAPDELAALGVPLGPPM